MARSKSESHLHCLKQLHQQQKADCKPVPLSTAVPLQHWQSAALKRCQGPTSSRGMSAEVASADEVGGVHHAHHTSSRVVALAGESPALGEALGMGQEWADLGHAPSNLPHPKVSVLQGMGAASVEESGSLELEDMPLPASNAWPGGHLVNGTTIASSAYQEPPPGGREHLAFNMPSTSFELALPMGNSVHGAANDDYGAHADDWFGSSIGDSACSPTVQDLIRQAHEETELPVHVLERLHRKGMLQRIPVDHEGRLTSVGTLKHADGQCKPCLFWFEGKCKRSVLCSYCHVVHRGQTRKRIRPSKRYREKMAVENLSEQ